MVNTVSIKIEIKSMSAARRYCNSPTTPMQGAAIGNRVVRLHRQSDREILISAEG